MPDWIYNLPDAAILALFAAVVVGFTALAQFLGRQLTRRRLDANADALSNAYRSVVTLAALVLAFSLVQAQTNLRDTAAAARREASVIDSLDRRLFELGTVPALAMRDTLKAYVQSILDTEWPAMAEGRESTLVDEALSAVTRQGRAAFAEGTAPRGLAGAIISEMDQLDDVRDARLTAALQRLPGVFWLGITTLVALAAVLAATIALSLPYAIGTLLPAAAIGILFGLTVVVDVSVRGESAARPDALIHVLHQIERRS